MRCALANLRRWLVTTYAIGRALLGGTVPPPAAPSVLVQTRDPKAEVGWFLYRLLGKRRATLRPMRLVKRRG